MKTNPAYRGAGGHPQPPPPEAPAPTPAEAAPAAPQLPWDEVEPEHFQLLRLVPLPADRTTGPRPLRFVQLGRAVRHSAPYSLLRMQIALPGQHTRPEQNRLDVWLDHTTHTLFTVPAVLQTEPANRGIGRFLLAEAAIWAQTHWGHYQLAGAELPNKDALVEDQRLRRDHVLKTHGLEVAYEDAQHLKGSYKGLRVGGMLATWNAERIQPVELLDIATMLQLADHKLQEKEVQLRKQEEAVSAYRRDDHSLRFTIACLIAFSVFQAGLLIWMATHR